MLIKTHARCMVQNMKDLFLLTAHKDFTLKRNLVFNRAYHAGTCVGCLVDMLDLVLKLLHKHSGGNLAKGLPLYPESS